MDLNITNIIGLPKEQLVSACHDATAVPAIIILGVLAPIIFFLVGIFNTSTPSSRKKIMVITIESMVFIFLVVVGLIFLPEVVQSIVGWFK